MIIRRASPGLINLALAAGASRSAAFPLLLLHDGRERGGVHLIKKILSFTFLWLRGNKNPIQTVCFVLIARVLVLEAWDGGEGERIRVVRGTHPKLL